MRRVVGLFVAVALTVLFVNQAFAQSFSTAKRNSDQSWTDTSTFNHTEKPWLHFSYKGFFNKDITLASWNYPAPGSSYYMDNFLVDNAEYLKFVDDSGETNLYLAFDDATWSNIIKPGEWDISAASILVNKQNEWGWPAYQAYYKNNLKFTVTPEPASCLLFLLGGGAVVGARRFRKK
jgi:hypothetical protein